MVRNPTVHTLRAGREPKKFAGPQYPVYAPLPCSQKRAPPLPSPAPSFFLQDFVSQTLLETGFWPDCAQYPFLVYHSLRRSMAGGLTPGECSLTIKGYQGDRGGASPVDWRQVSEDKSGECGRGGALCRPFRHPFNSTIQMVLGCCRDDRRQRAIL